jgi:hypothetical protein
MTQPTAADFTAIANDIRVVLGLPPYDGPDILYTEEELLEWDKILPGYGSQVWLLAVEQAEHRVKMTGSKD